MHPKDTSRPRRGKPDRDVSAEDEAASPILDERAPERGFTSCDHYDAFQALHTLRRTAERELLRLSWLMAMPIIPPAMYRSTTRRLMATSLDSCWGDHDEARRVLSAEFYKELQWIISDAPMCDVDWAMRIFALSDAVPMPAVKL